MASSPSRLPAGWTVPVWILFGLECFDIIRKFFGWWSEIDFIYNKLKNLSPVIDFILLPPGQFIVMLACVGFLSYSFFSSRNHVTKAADNDFISLRDAAIKLYEKARSTDSYLRYGAEGLSRAKGENLTHGSPDEILNYMATHISSYIDIYGKRPPSTISEKIKDLETNQLRFINGATALIHPNKPISWDNLLVKACDFNAKLDKMSRLDRD